MSRFLCAVLLATAPLGAESRGGTEADSSEKDVRRAMDRGVEYLLESQRKDGSWGGVRNATFTSAFANPATYHTWTVGTSGLATLAVLELGTNERAHAAVDRGLQFLIDNADLKRPAEWDVDNVWGLGYGLHTLARALQHERYRDSPRAEVLRKAAVTMVRGLRRYQSPRGGWGYYANPNSGWRPEWATSFTTAVVLLALVEAREAKVEVPDKVFRAAVRAVEHCRLPTGAYSYSVGAFPRHLRLESIDQIKGSLGRIQVCNFALYRTGSASLPARAREKGLELFFRYHRFLDVARNKTIPHEAYYANAPYFYLFAHYYAAQVIETLPPVSRDYWALRLRQDILKCQQKDGSFWDFWIASTTKPYGTAMSVMALARTLPEPAKGTPVYRSASLEANGVKLHYLDWRGTGETLLLLPGLGNTAHIYESMATRLSDRFRVIALTRRGHGLSGAPRSGYDAGTLAEDIRHFLDELKIDKAILVGHSIAGGELTAFAAKYPERTLKLVYLDAAYDRTTGRGLLAGNPLAPAYNSIPGDAFSSFSRYAEFMKSLTPELKSQWAKRKADLKSQVLIRPNGSVALRMRPEVYALLVQNMLSFRPDYSRIKPPILSFYAVSETNRDIPEFVSPQLRKRTHSFWREVRMPWARSSIEQLRKEAPHAEVVELKDTDHFCFIQREDEVVRRMRQFLLDES